MPPFFSKTHTQPAQPSLAITNCDSYVGQRLALQLADYLEKHRRRHSFEEIPVELVCLTRFPKKCSLLQKRANVKVVEFSYDDQSSLSVAIRGITTVILVPEMEPKRLDFVNLMVDTFKKEQVVRCIVISCIGTDAPEKGQLDAFRRTEDKVASSIQRWTVLREGFPFQALFYWIPMIQDQGTLGMSIKPDVVYAPLDIIDFGHALILVIFPKDPDNAAKHDGQIYTITGPEAVTGPKLADELCRALTPEKGREPDNSVKTPPIPVVYKETTKDEVRQYLMSLRDKKSPMVLSDTVFLDELETEGATTLTAFASDAPTKLSSTGLSGTWGFWQMVSGGGKSVDSSSSFASTSVQKLGGDEMDKDKKDEDPCKDPSCPRDHQNPKKPEGPEQLEPPKEPKKPKRPKEQGPVLEAPNDTEVDLVVELLEYIHEGRATFQSGDLKKIAGIEGVNAKGFFNKNAHNFRSRRPSAASEMISALTLNE